MIDGLELTFYQISTSLSRILMDFYLITAFSWKNYSLAPKRSKNIAYFLK
jgi:hypothetical protein